MKSLKTFYTKTKRYTPQEFLELSNEEKSNIESSKIINPDHLGSGLKTYIEVTFKRGVYRVRSREDIRFSVVRD